MGTDLQIFEYGSRSARFLGGIKHIFLKLELHQVFCFILMWGSHQTIVCARSLGSFYDTISRIYFFLGANKLAKINRIFHILAPRLRMDSVLEEHHFALFLEILLGFRTGRLPREFTNFDRFLHFWEHSRQSFIVYQAFV